MKRRPIAFHAQQSDITLREQTFILRTSCMTSTSAPIFVILLTCASWPWSHPAGLGAQAKATPKNSRDQVTV